MVMAFPPFLRVGAPLSVTVRRNERILRVVLLRGRLGGLGRWFRLLYDFWIEVGPSFSRICSHLGPQSYAFRTPLQPVLSDPWCILGHS